MPYLVPYSAGVRFLTDHMPWVLDELAKNDAVALHEGQRIGRLHTLEFSRASTDSASTRVKGTKIVVPLLRGEKPEDATVQARAQKAAERALRKEAEIVLPPRLKELAEFHNLQYGSIQIKKLKSRWGSCDSHKNIVLNLYLMQLPFELIDYVLYHELTHTVHMNHGPEFWRCMERLYPSAKKARSKLKQYKTSL